MNTVDEIIKRVDNLSSEQQNKMLSILKSWDSESHREYQRLSTQINIDVAIGNRVIQSSAENVSASGIYLRTSGKFSPDEKVRVVFTVPGMDKPFKLEGKVVRVEREGLAIQFEKITPYFKKMLDAVIWDKKPVNDEILS